MEEGHSKSEPSAGAKFFGFLIFLGLLWLGVSLFSSGESTPRERLVLDDACRSSIPCVYEYVAQDNAQIRCEMAIEDLARFDFEWGGIFEPKFERGVLEGNIFSMLGSSIKFQNGFGAYQRHEYFCKWNVETKEVVEVYAQPM